VKNISGGTLSRTYASFFLQDGPIELRTPPVMTTDVFHRSGTPERNHAR
jgi:hypothetical protein